jgi:hypothetical protein
MSDDGIMNKTEMKAVTAAMVNGRALYEMTKDMAGSTVDTGMTLCAALTFFVLTNSRESDKVHDIKNIGANLGLMELFASMYRQALPKDLEAEMERVRSLPNDPRFTGLGEIAKDAQKTTEELFERLRKGIG